MPDDDHDAPEAPSGCPPWCTTDHALQTHPDDRWHTSDEVAVAVLERRIVAVDAHGVDARLAAVEIAVLIEQPVDAPGCFVSFGPVDDRERSYQLSLDSAERLAEALTVAVVMVSTAAAVPISTPIRLARPSGSGR